MFNFTTKNSKIVRNIFIDRCWDRNRIRIGKVRSKSLLRAALNLRKFLLREKKISAVILKVEDLHSLELLCAFT